MKYIALIIALSTAAAVAQPFTRTDNPAVVDTLPKIIYWPDGRVTANPTWQQYQEAGYRKWVGCAAVSGSNAVEVGRIEVGDSIWAVCQYSAPEPEPTASPFGQVEMLLGAAWPILTNHPAAGEIPAAGLTYRLQESTNITWWLVRQGDVLATQLSAHNAAGEPITRTVNLRTGEDETINLRVLSSAQNFGQLRAARVVSTNAAIRGRGQR